ncbi:DUF1304 domain-containing protein [Acinetobacter stercoris]|uniref:DUF1304 domain-containing protein n=1 Tax=Acinetobacter stercoris TaxID=2126983 RepID=A0A2U3N2P3_9GAMM|nr:DUF1304 domain-containing protein [Acinetobacter stercoris]SPL71960.1 hypothetical protein KPC_3138 [Acinetobacter stercoris]
MISKILILLIALLHVYILVLEMFLWETPRGMKAFGNTPEKARATKPLAQNMGLYNGFLAAGLLWAVIAPNHFYPSLAYFFLGCVLVAGIYGSITASRKIIFIQAVPALITILSMVLGY